MFKSTINSDAKATLIKRVGLTLVNFGITAEIELKDYEQGNSTSDTLLIIAFDLTKNPSAKVNSAENLLCKLFSPVLLTYENNIQYFSLILPANSDYFFLNFLPIDFFTFLSDQHIESSLGLFRLKAAENTSSESNASNSNMSISDAPIDERKRLISQLFLDYYKQSIIFLLQQKYLNQNQLTFNIFRHHVQECQEIFKKVNLAKTFREVDKILAREYDKINKGIVNPEKTKKPHKGSGFLMALELAKSLILSEFGTDIDNLSNNIDPILAATNRQHSTNSELSSIAVFNELNELNNSWNTAEDSIISTFDLLTAANSYTGNATQHSQTLAYDEIVEDNRKQVKTDKAIGDTLPNTGYDLSAMGENIDKIDLLNQYSYSCFAKVLLISLLAVVCGVFICLLKSKGATFFPLAPNHQVKKVGEELQSIAAIPLKIHENLSTKPTNNFSIVIGFRKMPTEAQRTTTLTLSNLSGEKKSISRFFLEEVKKQKTTLEYLENKCGWFD